MARYTGPSTRINRRFGMALFPSNRAFENKPYPPGQHGPRLRRKKSEYAIGLDEKQKLRFLFGLTEKQFRITFEKAKNRRGVTGEIFLQLLETRLDSVVYTMGMARTRRAARQFVNHGHVLVNGHKVDIPSYQVAPGDKISVREATSSRALATQNLADNQFRAVPQWITVNADLLEATTNRVPTRDEMDHSVNEQLIVEFYSR
ncbi:30S ribosomal protein S4 [Puniceicoccus vermicola]|uniref:Small ribosomal subunit protein uS4 n=1 Tax=Puniceicoccus vermicola TaxID=388746 RepID=A0A7X1B0E6_9BACT|nr:30S ribosomal protein S4 [Puniceicoccus vermicola]MBC2603299.1 30S ribosomal protein S4 [Puniceicoccus vermicola]